MGGQKRAETGCFWFVQAAATAHRRADAGYMAVSPGFFKARFCVPLATDYRDLAVALVAGDSYTLGVAGLSARIAHTDARHRPRRRRIKGGIGRGRRPIDRDRGTGVIRNADIAPRIASVVPRRVRVNVAPEEISPVVTVVAQPQVGERLADMGMN